MFSRRATTYSVVTLFLTLGIASGQQPKRPAAEEPLPLLPAEQAWLVTLDAPTSAGGAMDDTRVYVPLSSQQLLALDRATGKQLWQRDVATEWPPVVHDGVIYLANDALQALDAATGNPRWSAALPGRVQAPIVYDTGWLLTVVDPGDVLAFRATDGTLVWQRRLGAAPIGAPIPGEVDTIYLSLADGRVVALWLTDGSPRWEQKLPGTLSQVGWAPDRVLVGSTNNIFYALDAEDGSLKWKWQTGGDVIGASYDDDVIFIASLDNIVRGVNRGNGNQRWRKDTGTRPLMPPLAFDRVAVVTGTNPTLSAFGARDGRPLGTFAAPGDLHGPPLIDPELKPYSVAIVLVMRNGTVAGLSPVALRFREQAPAPLALPGRVLQRDRVPQLR